MFLRIDTAATRVIGPVLDADGAAVTNAVIGDFSIAKNGTAAALASPATLTHLANGYYALALTTGNADTLGALEVYANNALHSMSTMRWIVIASQVYDSIVSGSDLLHVDARELVGSAQSASRILISDNSSHTVKVSGQHVGANVFEIQPDAINAAAVASDAVTKIQTGLATSAALATAQADLDIITGIDGVILSSDMPEDIATEIYSTVMETGVTFAQGQRIMLSILSGQVTGAGTGVEIFKACNNSGTNRVTVTVDQQGNRTGTVFNI